MQSHPRHITLRVTHCDGASAAPDLVKVFDEHGGTIGRAAQNDWALADATRTLSAHHATVYFDQGRFHLVDCSSNGVFLNDDDEPLGIERIAALHDGDRLLLGGYRLVVELNGAATRALDAPEAAAPRTSPGAALHAVADDTGWLDLGPAPHHVAPAGRDAIVDPLELLDGPARQVDAPGAQRNDAPLLASPFRAPIALGAVAEDWLEPLASPAPASSPVPTSAPTRAPDTAQALQRAGAALREAIALIESLQANLAVEARHGLA